MNARRWCWESLVPRRSSIHTTRVCDNLQANLHNSTTNPLPMTAKITKLRALVDSMCDTRCIWLTPSFEPRAVLLRASSCAIKKCARSHRCRLQHYDAKSCKAAAAVGCPGHTQPAFIMRCRGNLTIPLIYWLLSMQRTEPRLAPNCCNLIKLFRSNEPHCDVRQLVWLPRSHLSAAKTLAHTEAHSSTTTPELVVVACLQVCLGTV